MQKLFITLLILLAPALVWADPPTIYAEIGFPCKMKRIGSELLDVKIYSRYCPEQVSAATMEEFRKKMFLVEKDWVKEIQVFKDGQWTLVPWEVWYSKVRMNTVIINEKEITGYDYNIVP